MPVDLGGVLNMLVLNRSSLTLPLIEHKIEEVLASKSPQQCFTVPEVDPNYFVRVAAVTITEAANEQALREIGKLLILDRERFGDLVDRALGHAQNRGTAYTLAYRGLELADPALASKIIEWVEEQLAMKDQYAIVEVRRSWADALVDKYGGVPVSSEWTSDPIVSRLKTSQSRTFRDEMYRYIWDAFEKKTKK